MNENQGAEVTVDVFNYDDTVTLDPYDGPILPYPEPDGEGRTSGWSGTDTSHERAQSADAGGVTRIRQIQTLNCAVAAGLHGVTVKDLRETTGLHHGQASSILSVLHKEERLLRLTERRDRCHVYIHPRFQNGRETQPHGRNKVNVLEAEREKLYATFKAGWGYALESSGDMNLGWVDEPSVKATFDMWLAKAIDEVDVLGFK